MIAGGRHNWRGYLFIAPAMIYLAIFSFVPMIVAAYLSLHRWHLLKLERPFVGLANYAELLRDPFFLNAMKNTMVFTLLSVPIGMVTALAVAVLASRRLPGVGVFRTLYYIPAVVSQVAVSMMWIWILLPDSGLINSILKGVGLAGDIDFLKQYAMLSLVAVSVWIGLGPRMVIFLAGLQGIPEVLYEAARLDGCTDWQRFRHVTLPLLMPTTFFVLVTSTIASFQIFTPVYIMTRGGPARSTDMVVYHVYKEAWHQFHVGTASAQSYVLFLMILLVALVQFAVMRRRSREIAEAW